MTRLRVAAPRITATDTRALKPPPKVADPFYRSPEWRKLVTQIIADRGRRCQDCGRTHDRQGQPIRIFGDHVKELRDGGKALDARNVRLLCGACHTRKTLAERARRMAMVG